MTSFRKQFSRIFFIIELRVYLWRHYFGISLVFSNWYLRRRLSFFKEMLNFLLKRINCQSSCLAGTNIYETGIPGQQSSNRDYPDEQLGTFVLCKRILEHVQKCVPNLLKLPFSKWSFSAPSLVDCTLDCTLDSMSICCGLMWRKSVWTSRLKISERWTAQKMFLNNFELIEIRKAIQSAISNVGYFKISLFRTNISSHKGLPYQTLIFYAGDFMSVFRTYNINMVNIKSHICFF